LIESGENETETGDDDTDIDTSQATDTGDYILTEIESRIAQNNLKVHARIASKG
jgi:hypothetical protein